MQVPSATDVSHRNCTGVPRGSLIKREQFPGPVLALRASLRLEVRTPLSACEACEAEARVGRCPLNRRLQCRGCSAVGKELKEASSGFIEMLPASVNVS